MISDNKLEAIEKLKELHEQSKADSVKLLINRFVATTKILANASRLEGLFNNACEIENSVDWKGVPNFLDSVVSTSNIDTNEVERTLSILENNAKNLENYVNKFESELEGSIEDLNSSHKLRKSMGMMMELVNGYDFKDYDTNYKNVNSLIADSGGNLSMLSDDYEIACGRLNYGAELNNNINDIMWFLIKFDDLTLHKDPDIYTFDNECRVYFGKFENREFEISIRHHVLDRVAAVRIRIENTHMKMRNLYFDLRTKAIGYYRDRYTEAYNMGVRFNNLLVKDRCGVKDITGLRNKQLRTISMLVHNGRSLSVGPVHNGGGLSTPRTNSFFNYNIKEINKLIYTKDSVWWSGLDSMFLDIDTRKTVGIGDITPSDDISHGSLIRDSAIIDMQAIATLIESLFTIYKSLDMKHYKSGDERLSNSLDKYFIDSGKMTLDILVDVCFKYGRLLGLLISEYIPEHTTVIVLKVLTDHKEYILDVVKSRNPAERGNRRPKVSIHQDLKYDIDNCDDNELNRRLGCIDNAIGEVSSINKAYLALEQAKNTKLEELLLIFKLTY